MAETDSIRAGNLFRFRCPSVARNAGFLACSMRRRRHWRGERIEADCGTCMNAGRCPIILMTKMEWAEGKALFIDTVGEKLHKVPKEVLAEISRRMTVRSQVMGDMPEEQFARLMANDMEDSYVEPVDTTPTKKYPPRKVKDDPASVAALDHTDISKDLLREISKEAAA